MKGLRPCFSISTWTQNPCFSIFQKISFWKYFLICFLMSCKLQINVANILDNCPRYNWYASIHQKKIYWKNFCLNVDPSITSVNLIIDNWKIHYHKCCFPHPSTLVPSLLYQSKELERFQSQFTYLCSVQIHKISGKHYLRVSRKKKSQLGTQANKYAFPPHPFILRLLHYTKDDPNDWIYEYQDISYCLLDILPASLHIHQETLRICAAELALAVQHLLNVGFLAYNFYDCVYIDKQGFLCITPLCWWNRSHFSVWMRRSWFWKVPGHWHISWTTIGTYFHCSWSSSRIQIHSSFVLVLVRMFLVWIGFWFGKFCKFEGNLKPPFYSEHINEMMRKTLKGELHFPSDIDSNLMSLLQEVTHK